MRTKGHSWGSLIWWFLLASYILRRWPTKGHPPFGAISYPKATGCPNLCLLTRRGGTSYTGCRLASRAALVASRCFPSSTTWRCGWIFHFVEEWDHKVLLTLSSILRNVIYKYVQYFNWGRDNTYWHSNSCWHCTRFSSRFMKTYCDVTCASFGIFSSNQ